MLLRCLACGTENPATNVYCGQCGAKLHRTAMDAPERDTLPRDGEAEADARTKEEAERKRRTEIARWKEIELESRGIFMPWNIQTPGSDPARDAANARPVVDAASEPRTSQPPVVQDVPPDSERVEVESTVRTAVPSVLGLHDDAPANYEGLAEYDRKQKVKSRSQHNIALAVLAAAVILAAFQWYSIRDSVVPYVQYEVQRARQQNGPVVVPPTVPTNHTSPAPVKDSPVVPVAPIAPAPGAAEMYQAAHAGDPRLRVAWLWKAVRTGNSQASVALAKMYEDGEGVTQSCEQARILLSAAANKGNAQAKVVLKQLPLDEGCAAP